VRLIAGVLQGNHMGLYDDIKAIADNGKIDFFGIADLSSAHDAISTQGGNDISRFPRAVSIGVTLIHTIVDQLSKEPNKVFAELYRYHCYEIVNDILDKAAFRISSLLQDYGHAALPVPAAPHAIDLNRLCGIFSNKMAAHLAGLGWIGKNCLLITPEVGPRARWASVLTDADLMSTGSSQEPRCGECNKCVDICPVHAFTGKNFISGDSRDERFSAHQCNEYMRAMKEKTGHRICGLCLKVCPYGKKGIAEQINTAESQSGAALVV
jgi:epoxyqueuosine reductase QueG